PAKKLPAFMHLANELGDRTLGRNDIGSKLCGTRHNVPSLAYGEIAQERDHISADIDQQHATQANPVVNESNHRTSNEPAALNSGHQKRVRMNELVLGSELLNECADSRPEHPEAGGHQHVHQVELPYLYLACKGENRDHENDDGSNGVQHHDQPPTVFAVDNHARKGE